MDVQVQDCEKYSLKPDIRIGNYYFKWDASDGLGIDVREINHFKNFIRKIIPLLEQYMIFLQNKIDKNDPFKDKKQICIKEKYDKKISFLMFIDSQGSTLFFREESCNVDDVSKHEKDFGVESLKLSNIQSSSNNNDSTIKVELKWLLGELLFDRNKQDNLRKKTSQK